ncbi:hypothetical protein VP01_1345g3 [Puccinia sorghi]|uniref:Uncharacterized protein n=1 Tax=Puccinia sorghi TaxID=27349 RepID=A0A0L6VP08_9BASI|nr:hypothetical protein VP01_1345g3 [Puccinia sorghi]
MDQTQELEIHAAHSWKDYIFIVWEKDKYDLDWEKEMQQLEVQQKLRQEYMDSVWQWISEGKSVSEIDVLMRMIFQCRIFVAELINY